MVYVADPVVVGLGGGSSTGVLPGSRLSPNAGVESIFYYNGLKLNDRSVIDKYRVTKVEGFDDADIRFAEDDAPSDDGTIPRTNRIGGRTIVLTGRIEAHNLDKLRDMQAALQYAFSSMVELPMYVTLPANYATQFFVECRKSQKISMGDEQESAINFFRPFMVTLRASNPRKFLTADSFDYASPLVAGTNIVINPNNVGNFTAQPIIRILGGVTSLVLTNLRNGMNFTVDSVPSTGWYEIDCKQKKIYSDAGVSARSHFSGAKKYIKYESGVNQISVTIGAVSGTPQLLSTYYPAFI